MVALWKTPPGTENDDEAEGFGCPEFLERVRLDLNQRKFDFIRPRKRPHPVLKLGDKTISTPGNLTNIQAPPKAGKSGVVGGILAAALTDNRHDADTLGFSASNPEGKAVLHFDTEQSPFDHDSLVRRAMERAGTNEEPSWLYSYCLTDLGVKARLEAIGVALDDAANAHTGILMVIIDGVADICNDPNNSQESFELVADLHSKAIHYDCAIITVLHENPGSNDGKMRGHLGSQLERKAETPLRLHKDSAGVTTIWADRARHCHIPKGQGTCFSWCDVAGMHVTRGTAAVVKVDRKREEYVKEATALFAGADSFSTYTDFKVKIMEVLELKVDAAKKRIAEYVKAGVAFKYQDGTYHLLPLTGV